MRLLTGCLINEAIGTGYRNIVFINAKTQVSHVTISTWPKQ
jgi:hypothetical protein